MGINHTHFIPIYLVLTNLAILFIILLRLNFRNEALFFKPQQGLKMLNVRPKTLFFKKERWDFIVYGVGFNWQT
jgi:hypothetical protein